VQAERHQTQDDDLDGLGDDHPSDLRGDHPALPQGSDVQTP
jgi:hypothetical protein